MTFVYLDTETTGLDPHRHDVWEIAYALDDGAVLSQIVQHSTDGADPEALEINNYYVRTYDRFVDSKRMSPHTIRTPDDWERARRFADNFEARLIELLKDATVVGANPAFDTQFLFERWGVRPWRYRLLDIQAYAMPFMRAKEPPSLRDIVSRLRLMSFSISFPDHTAGKDVYVTRQVHRILAEQYAKM